MPSTPTDLFAFLDRLGIPHSTVSHPPLFTVEESRTLRGTIPGGHTKNLFLKDKSGAHYLVVACEEATIDLKGLHRRLGAKGRFSFGSADALRELLGVEPGSVTPFAAINDVSGKVVVILDRAMLTHELLNYHPLVNTMTTSIPRAGLMTFLKACGHEPCIESASESPTPHVIEGDGGRWRAGRAGVSCNRIIAHHLIGLTGTRGRPLPQDKERSIWMNVGVATAGAGDVVSDVTTQTFRKDVIEESRRQPVLVDFWAPWCGPCKQLTPILEKAVRAAKGAVRLAKMNIDEHPAIASQLGIQSIPAVIAFVNGQPADGFMGALPESQVIAFLERVTKQEIGGQEKELLKSADAALVAGEPAAAVELYSEVLAGDPAQVHALAGLARALVETGNIEEAKHTLEQVPESKRNDSAVAAARAALEVAEQAAHLGPVAELEQKVAANPLDHQARFDLAVALNANNRRQEALDQLLEIVRRDRKWNEDAARRQLVQFFEAWGPTDEHTVSGRRRLSSILFA